MELCFVRPLVFIIEALLSFINFITCYCPAYLLIHFTTYRVKWVYVYIYLYLEMQGLNFAFYIFFYFLLFHKTTSLNSRQI